MLLAFKERIRGGITQSSHRHAEANNKYMKNHDKNKEKCLKSSLQATLSE